MFTLIIMLMMDIDGVLVVGLVELSFYAITPFCVVLWLLCRVVLFESRRRQECTVRLLGRKEKAKFTVQPPIKTRKADSHYKLSLSFA